MKRVLLIIVTVFWVLTSVCHAESPDSGLNLDFESVDKNLPLVWQSNSANGYTVSADTSTVKSGKYSACMEFSGETPSSSMLYMILPNVYEGELITLSGYIKTENITDGYTGLWIQLNPMQDFVDMSANGIKGTTDWMHYSISIPMKSKKIKNIYVGVSLYGKGKMWIDDLKITIDGKDIMDAKIREPKVFVADSDHEFDNGSGIADIKTDKKTIALLSELCHVWGFLKYYHPAVASGKYNWDFELFRILPQITAAKSKSERETIYTTLIKKMGHFELAEKKGTDPSHIKLTPDYNWIEKARFSDTFTALLRKLINAKRPDEHYYISFQESGNPDLGNEKPYPSVTDPDTGFRLLALYRYWNIIQYLYPNRHLISGNWEDILPEFIPKVIRAVDKTAYTLAMLELIGKISDTHANIWGANKTLKSYWGNRYAAVIVNFIDEQPVVSGFYDDDKRKESGLQLGDVILEVNGKTIHKFIKSRLPYTPASNYTTQLRDIAFRFFRSNDTTITVQFLRDGKKMTAIVPTYPETEIDIYKKYDPVGPGFKILENNIGYLNNGIVTKADLPKIWPDVMKTKALIIDIRNYPKDFHIFELAKYLLPDSTPFVKFSQASASLPGLFTYTDTVTAGQKNPDYYKGTIIILINEMTQSSAEYHSMAYRTHPNAIVIGSQTAAADGDVSSLLLPGNISTMISGIGVYYPDGTETQRVGIVPDIIVKPTIDGIKNGRDEVLEKAIEVINGK